MSKSDSLALGLGSYIKFNRIITIPTTYEVSVLNNLGLGQFVSNSKLFVTDWKFPNSCEIDFSYGAQSWTSLDNLKIDDSNEATIYFNGNEVGYSYYGAITDFGFLESDISDGSTILGIEFIVGGIRATYYDLSGYTYATLDRSRLIKGGVIDDIDIFPEAYPALVAPSNGTIGGNGQLGNFSWLPSDIRASNFGLVISFVNDDNQSNMNNVFINYVKCRVYASE